MTEVFGTPIQRAMQMRAHALWTLLKNDRRIMCHGRLLSVSFETPDCVELVMALAHLQGSAGFENVPSDAVKLVQRPLHEARLKTEVAVEWVAGANALRYADKALLKIDLPDELTLQRVTKDTPPAVPEQISDLAMRSGEWMAMGLFMRGMARPSAFMYLADPSGKPVAVAGCVVHAGRYHHREEEGWWGMLAVDEAWRRKGLSHYIGAHVLRQMRIDHGIENFTTVVRSTQEGYAKLVQNLGFSPTRKSSIYVQDTSGFG